MMAVCALRCAAAARITLKRSTSVTTVYSRKYWNKDFKPGPYPRTPEERAAAAKKYGMLPEDYEPYPDDGFGFGDYPKLPKVSYLGRDQFYAWDIPDAKRNFGEPIHVDDDIYVEDRFDVSAKPFISYNKMALILSAVLLTLGGLILMFEQSRQLQVMPKSLPQEGVIHYTFEPADTSDHQ